MAGIAKTQDSRWFSEASELWPGRITSLEFVEQLHAERSEFQHIELYQTRSCGRMLALDGIIQFTESDEFAYHEMLAHLPLFAHPNPRRVLVIGGGDGGILREVARHSVVEQLDLCELDPQVIEVCQRFVPSLAVGFEDPRVKVYLADGAAFLADRVGEYDVVIVDSTDPIGPAQALFAEPFYKLLRRSLTPGGIVAAQAESIFLLGEVVERLVGIVKRNFDSWAYANVLVPTYPGGCIGVCLGSLGPPLITPARQPDADLASQLRYYSPAMHVAAFVLPAFAERRLISARERPGPNR